MTAVSALVALPVAVAAIWLTLRSPLARPAGARARRRALAQRPHAARRRDRDRARAARGRRRWRSRPAPSSRAPSSRGILAGTALLFLAGLADDLWSLPPLAKIGAQLAAAAIVLGSGLSVEIVDNDALALALGLLWLVGMTNAFNLLDNMDGLAATLAAIACAYFAIDAVTVHPSDTVLVLSLGLGLACAGFLPFNVRPGRPAAVFMGDSGSQAIGFALASLGLLASWNVAGTTVATLLLPILILAVPILDTALVTVVRLLEGTAGLAGRARPHLAPDRLPRALRAARARAARRHLRRARRDEPRLQRARRRAHRGRRRARHVRRARPVRELPRRRRADAATPRACAAASTCTGGG